MPKNKLENWLQISGLLAFVIVILNQCPLCADESPSSTESSQSAGVESAVASEEWTQWRGPHRDGKLNDKTWPDSLSQDVLRKTWSVPLGPSYSGPIVVGGQVFSTETKDRKSEVVSAFDSSTGKKLWSTEWLGAMSVPFFAKSNGDWIRSTPAYDDGRLYVAGIRDVLVCLNAKDGKEIWKVDFPKKFGTSLPSFGFVCSPLVDGDALYVQAGGAFCKLNKTTGEVIWQGLKDGGGMNGSAFSSPVIATVAGARQAIVQTRSSLCGVDLQTGETLWNEDIPTFRGMNIITPTIYKDGCITSAYGGTTQLLNLSKDSKFKIAQQWNLPAQGYMTTPVVIDGHAYTHLRNQRFACYDLNNGVEKWRSKPFGKYASLVASGNKILALDERGNLLLIKANPEKFDLIDSRKVGDDSWAHLAVRGNEVFVRNLKELVAFEWTQPAK